MGLRGIRSFALCGFAFVGLGAASGCGSHCDGFINCPAPIVVTVNLSHAPSPTLEGVALKLCRNQVCASGTIANEVATLVTSEFEVDVKTVTAASPVQIILTPSLQGYVIGGDVANGDSYEVSVMDGQSVLVDDTRTVTFDQITSGCNHTACFQASYTIQQ